MKYEKNKFIVEIFVCQNKKSPVIWNVCIQAYKPLSPPFPSSWVIFSAQLTRVFFLQLYHHSELGFVPVLFLAGPEELCVLPGNVTVAAAQHRSQSQLGGASKGVAVQGRSWEENIQLREQKTRGNSETLGSSHCPSIAM